MRIYDIIQRKRDGASLTDEEIRYAVNGFTNSEIPDYQMSALLMAVYLNGMDKHEQATLTKVMMESGDIVDLSIFGELTADKHSTGGVGDKTTLIVAPIVAALGGKVAKMSGRGLGHTGGTVDKLEAIPGYKTTLTREEFIKQVQDIGIAVISQSGRIAPADKKIYALRDVTATIESIPLIASSIMSKKLATGAYNIVLDVKYGSGAFMKTLDDAKKLAETMVDIGEAASRRVSAVITNMDVPLGDAVGNALEVIEAAEVLKGKGSEDLTEICVALSAQLLSLTHGWRYDDSTDRVREALHSGQALEKFKEWITVQGGSADFLSNSAVLGVTPIQYNYNVKCSGFITHMNAELIGKAAAALGAGREKSGDTIDYLAGIILHKKTGDYCASGDTAAVLHTSDQNRLAAACDYLDQAMKLGPEKPETTPLIHDFLQ